jgi:mannitol/fructose-specific phosphotransferase system IIA component (Ntr-type)
VGTHLRLLSRASRLLSNPGFRAQLLQVQTPQEVLRLFEHAEALTAQLE